MFGTCRRSRYPYNSVRGSIDAARDPRHAGEPVGSSRGPYGSRVEHPAALRVCKDMPVSVGHVENVIHQQGTIGTGSGPRGANFAREILKDTSAGWALEACAGGVEHIHVKILPGDEDLVLSGNQNESGTAQVRIHRII